MNKKTKDCHIRIDEDIDKIINDNAIKNHTSYSKETNRLLELSQSKDNAIMELNKMINIICDIQRKVNLNFLLTKQLYSDMEFPETTNPNQSDNLNKFFKNKRVDKYEQ